MSNQITMTEFLLLSFSEARELQILHYVVFLGIFLAGLMLNLFIIAAVALDHHLHAPMYFFLVNLSMIDLGFISITVPKSMANSLLNPRTISYSGCVAQVFLFIFFTVFDLVFLTIMAYDCYVTICKPFHYESLMNRRACIEMAASARISGIFCSALHIGNTLALIFCGGNMVDQFFCEIPQLLKLTCSDSYLSEAGVIAFFACLTISCFVLIVVSYIQIFTTVLRIPSERGQDKAIYICLPHLIVVSLFVCTGTFAYVKPPSICLSGLDFVVGVLYSMVPPIMNQIYSLRNKEIKGALRKLTR